jgi:hypothetical protein
MLKRRLSSQTLTIKHTLICFDISNRKTKKRQNFSNKKGRAKSFELLPVFLPELTQAAGL